MRRSNKRQYPDRPFLGVGALIFRRNSILLVERGGVPLKGYWSLPGGIVETGEMLEQALQRELFEETGLRVQPLRVAEIFERIMPDAAGRIEYHYVLVDYVCKVVGGTLAPADDVARAAWVPVKKLKEYRLTEGTQAVIERVWQSRKPA
ncbi:MAG: NUDIX hydrolase [Bryobacteraceae bacterium]|nr:NUDIX hydrolase [Bryobacteraceae bacterium]